MDAPENTKSRLLAALAALAAAALGAGCGDDSSSPSDRYRLLATDVRVTGVSVFQAVEVPLARDGTEFPDPSATIVSGKATAVVVFLEPGPGFVSRSVTVALAVKRDGSVRWHEVSTVPTSPSTVENPASVAVFELEGSEMSGDVSISVAATDPAGTAVPEGTSSDARYPADGTKRALPLADPGAPIRLVLIPIRYARGGNEYVPDTSAAQIERYRSLLAATYPATAWDIVLHEEVYWDRPMTAWGFDFTALNEWVSDLKSSERDDPRSHYYSLVSPAESFPAYCSPVCVAGQSYLVMDPRTASLLVGAGLGFTGDDSAWTLVHELGHVFGRGHSGCSVPRDDPSYPYAGGTIGVWGRDSRSGTFRSPRTADFMGYCSPQWLSDYTWNRLYERVMALAALRAKAAPVRSRMLHVDFEAGVSRWGAETFAGESLIGPAIPVSFGPGAVAPPGTLPIVLQSDGRHGTVLVPVDLVPELRALRDPSDVPVP